MNINKLLYPFVTMAVTTALVSCNHKDLCYCEGHKSKVRVVYDWSQAPESTAAGMCVFFYSTENSDEYYRFDFDNVRGGEIEIPAGNYVLITYNNDTEIVRFSGTNVYGIHDAYTRTGDLLEPLYGNGVTSSATTVNGERVCVTPDALWGCHATDVVISDHGVKYTHYDFFDVPDARADESTDSITGDQTITLYPHDMLCHYTYEVRHVDNLQYVSKISAAISGMAPSMSMSDESFGSDHVTLPLSATVNRDSQTITGQFLTFGNPDDSSIDHKMTFFVEMTDGSKYRIEGDDNLDVTSQVDNAPDRRHVHIIIDRLKLPQPGVENGDWYPTVDDWGVHYEDLPV